MNVRQKRAAVGLAALGITMGSLASTPTPTSASPAREYSGIDRCVEAATIPTTYEAPRHFTIRFNEAYTAVEVTSGSSTDSMALANNEVVLEAPIKPVTYTINARSDEIKDCSIEVSVAGIGATLADVEEAALRTALSMYKTSPYDTSRTELCEGLFASPDPCSLFGSENRQTYEEFGTLDDITAVPERGGTAVSATSTCVKDVRIYPHWAGGGTFRLREDFGQESDVRQSVDLATGEIQQFTNVSRVLSGTSQIDQVMAIGSRLQYTTSDGAPLVVDATIDFSHKTNLHTFYGPTASLPLGVLFPFLESSEAEARYQLRALSLNENTGAQSSVTKASNRSYSAGIVGDVDYKNDGPGSEVVTFQDLGIASGSIHRFVVELTHRTDQTAQVGYSTRAQADNDDTEYVAFDSVLLHIESNHCWV